MTYLSKEIDVMAEPGGYYLFNDNLRMWYSEYKNYGANEVTRWLSFYEFENGKSTGKRTSHGIRMELGAWVALLENAPAINKTMTKNHNPDEDVLSIPLGGMTKQAEPVYDHGVWSVELRTYLWERGVCKITSAPMFTHTPTNEGIKLSLADWNELVLILPSILALHLALHK
jgi:hypothetical protein